MRGKFDSYTCWKHEDCMDAFIRVHSISQDDGLEAKLRVQWMVQGTGTFWSAPVDIAEIHINSENYSKWKSFTPKHEETL